MSYTPPPLPSQPTGERRRPERVVVKQGAPWWVVLVIALVTGFIGAIGGWMAGFVVGTGVFDFDSFDYVTLEGMDLTIESPATVETGEKFDIVVTVTNNGSQTQQLDGVDFYTSYLEGFEIVSSEPAWTDDVEDYGDYLTYPYPRTIAPGQTVTIRFNFVAGDTPGIYADDIELWFNGNAETVYEWVQTEIVSAPE